MKKARFLIVPLLAVLFFILFAPVLAEPTITPIKAIQVNTSNIVEKTWTTNGGIVQEKDVLNQGTIRLYIPSTASSPTYTFEHYNVYNRMRNPEKLHSTICVDVTWNYKVADIIVGTFEGQIQWNIVDGVPQAHGVLHGKGVFDGQQLMFWKDNTQLGIVWVGTLKVK